jgi:hypothetical protein
LLRRGPQAIARRLEAIRSAARIAAQSPVAGDETAIAVLVGGVVGDSIMTARFLRDLQDACHDLVFDIFSADVRLSRWVLGPVKGVRQHYQDLTFDASSAQYDVALFFSDSVSVWNGARAPDTAKSPRLAMAVTALRAYASGRSENPDLFHRQECVLAQEVFFRHGKTRAELSQFLTGIDYGGPLYDLAVEEIDGLGPKLAGAKYVTVHNGYSLGEIGKSRTSTKSYMRFGEVLAQVRKRRADLKFVQIGAGTSVPIEGVDVQLIGKTSLPQAAGLIKNAACHLDNESGFVTVASCFGTPSCVVYGPTSADYFAYAGNVAVRPVECGGCWWTAKDWMTRCPRGMAEPVCMRSQPPEAVAAALLGLLESLGR